MRITLSDLVNENNINEMGIRSIQRLTGSGIGRTRQTVINSRGSQSTVSYRELSNRIIDAFIALQLSDITMRKSGEKYYPQLPTNIINLIREIRGINREKAIDDFGKWDNLDDSDAIYMKTDPESSYQRSHFPNDGIPPNIRGIKLGYKLYRTLVKYAGYISSNAAGTVEKDRAWSTMLSFASNDNSTPNEYDVHGIIGPSNWMAIDRETMSNSRKIEVATNFIVNKIGVDNSLPDRFDIDDDLIAILPNQLLGQLQSTYLDSLLQDNRLTQERYSAIIETRGQADRLRAQQLAREQELASQNIRQRYNRFGVTMDSNIHNWEVGDFIVVKQYLDDVSYDSLPIRRVVSLENGTYTAIKIRDMQSGTLTDTRTTSNKTVWAKVDLAAIPNLDEVNLTSSEKQWVREYLSGNNPTSGFGLSNTHRQINRKEVDQSDVVTIQRGDHDTSVDNISQENLRKFGVIPNQSNIQFEVGDFVVSKNSLANGDALIMRIGQVNSQRDIITYELNEMIFGGAPVTGHYTSNQLLKIDLRNIEDLNVVNLIRAERRWVDQYLEGENPRVSHIAFANVSNLPDQYNTIVTQSAPTVYTTQPQQQDNDNEHTAIELVNQVYETSTTHIATLLQNRQNSNDSNLRIAKTLRRTPSNIILIPHGVRLNTFEITPVIMPYIRNSRNLSVTGVFNNVDSFTDLLDRVPTRIGLINLVTLETYTVRQIHGMSFSLYTLSEVEELNKRDIQEGDLFYIANHLNTYGIIAKAAYTTRNTSAQPFVYMKTGLARPTPVRLDLVKGISFAQNITV